METARKSFCIVCLANYCRSPVAESLLKERFKDEYEFFSAGISPLAMANMDPRSFEFLKKNNINFNFHNPKKINIKMLNYFDIFLAVDFFVLNKLNDTYPKFRHKFRSLTAQFIDLNINDPYQYQDSDYIRVMEDIKYVVQKIDLEDYFI